MVIIDSTNVKSAQLPDVERAFRLPITEAAIAEVGNRITANVVALGAINALEGIVSWDSLRQALISRIPARFCSLNERALRVGSELGLPARRP